MYTYTLHTHTCNEYLHVSVFMQIKCSQSHASLTKQVHGGADNGSGPPTVSASVTCLRGELEDRVTTPLGTVLRVFNPHVRTRDETQVVISTELRRAMCTAATFLHFPALALALKNEPLYVSNHSCPDSCMHAPKGSKALDHMYCLATREMKFF